MDARWACVHNYPLCMSLRNFCQTGTYQHTVNANELCIKALPDQADS